MRLGIRSVTMDEVSRELGISKKTIYQYFENKDELVCSVAYSHLSRETKEFEAIAFDSTDAIDELHQIAICMRKNFTEINPSMLHDLQKYHPDAWAIFMEFKMNIIGNILQNLERGIKEGFYRPEINAEVLSIMRFEQLQLVFDDRLFPREKFSFLEVQMQVFEHFVYGILTDKGRSKYESYKQKEHNPYHT